MYFVSWTHVVLWMAGEQKIEFFWRLFEGFWRLVSHLDTKPGKDYAGSASGCQRVKIGKNHPDMNCQILRNSDLTFVGIIRGPGHPNCHNCESRSDPNYNNPGGNQYTIYMVHQNALPIDLHTHRRPSRGKLNSAWWIYTCTWCPGHHNALAHCLMVEAQESDQWPHWEMPKWDNVGEYDCAVRPSGLQK